MRSISFVKLVAGRRVPIQQALKLFQKDRRTDYETRVMRLAQQALLSTAEIIKCVEQDVAYLPNEQFLMEAVYGDDETTCYNIAGIMKNSRSSQAVTLAVANLYLPANHFREDYHMKNQWNQFPFVLRRKILLTFLAGLASIALSLIIFIITTDHILLVLGSIIFLASLVLVRSLWSTIARGQYEIVEGVCSSVISPVIRRYRKIQLIDGQGAERTLLLSKSAKFQIGALYRFYFQTGSRPVVGNDYLDAALSTNSFLGYEALGEPAVPEEQAKENG